MHLPMSVVEITNFWALGIHQDTNESQRHSASVSNAAWGLLSALNTLEVLGWSTDSEITEEATGGVLWEKMFLK